MEEPSVLDYVKSKLAPWKYPRIELQAEDKPTEFALELSEVAPEPSGRPQAPRLNITWPWRSLLALVLALMAQSALEPRPERTWTSGVLLYALALVWAVWAAWKSEWQLPDPKPAPETAPDSLNIRTGPLLASLPLAILAFFASSGNRFTLFNLILLFSALGLMISAFWQSSESVSLRSPLQRLKSFLRRPRWSFSVTPQGIGLAAAFLLALYFRFHQLNLVPLEMNSDHAEKLMDISRVLQGETNIFFPNNGGREALQMYLVASLHRFFGVELSFLALKLSTALIGLLSLPFLYGLGKEIGGKRVGLLAVAFAGVAYWPNVVSRAGLRLPFYIFFSAAVLYFLVRGLRVGRRNDLILAGITLGFSLYGYSADRILPLLVVVTLAVWAIHQGRSKSTWQRSLAYLLMIALLALILALPMARYMLEQPDAFLYRTLSRLSSVEQPLSQPPLAIFFNNLQRAMVMFSWDDGEVWTLSVPHRPALDVTTGALYWLGFGLVLLRYLRRRRWTDLLLLVSIPILLLPSVLALAFPNENPNLYRAGGALIPAFLLIALALDGLMGAVESHLPAKSGKNMAWALAGLLFLLSTTQSYDLVFRQYAEEYNRSSWNSSEMGEVIRTFTETMGSVENTWVMAFPYWVDTRLVAMNAGYPEREFVLTVEQLSETVGKVGPKLFIIKPDDVEAQQRLRQVYPKGWFQNYISKVETKDFLMFFAPPEGQNTEILPSIN